MKSLCPAALTVTRLLPSLNFGFSSLDRVVKSPKEASRHLAHLRSMLDERVHVGYHFLFCCISSSLTDPKQTITAITDNEEEIIFRKCNRAVYKPG